MVFSNRWLFLLVASIPWTVDAQTSWAGVNHYYLASLPTDQMKASLDRYAASNVRVVRTFLRGQSVSCEKQDATELHDDVTDAAGNLNVPAMQRYDNMLAYAQSKGIKIILAMHNGNFFGTTSCDAFCAAGGGVSCIWPENDCMPNGATQNTAAANNFYTDNTIINGYDTRIKNVLNYNGAIGRWGAASGVILAIDIENEPLLRGSPNDGGASWICGRANTIRANAVGGILVSTGGIHGSNGGSTSNINFPSWVFGSSCNNVNVIAIHDYLGGNAAAIGGAAQTWYDMLIQKAWNGALRTAADNSGKLVMVEEFDSSVVNTDLTTRNSDIYWQTHAMNVRGIPWLYWDVTIAPEGTNSNPAGCTLNNEDLSMYGGSWSGLSAQMQVASTAITDERWNDFVPQLPGVTPVALAVTYPPGYTSASSCSWGCLGWTCSNVSPCQGDNQCVSGVCKPCTWGCKGWSCSASSPCKDAFECDKGVCSTCTWGCQGWSCNANSPCQGENDCVNNVCKPCTWGCTGWPCSSSSPCKTVNQCISGTCGPCLWGCPGWTCNAVSPCQGDQLCTNGVCSNCTWGCLGWACSAVSPCHGENECGAGGICKGCTWGCLGWSCSASAPCKKGYTCSGGTCKIA